MKVSVALLALCCATSCRMNVQPASVGDVPPERAGECVQVCRTLGMRLSAVVVQQYHPYH
jgi:hypothetical protein